MNWAHQTQELNKFMLDQVTQRRTEAPMSMALDIAIPMKLRQRDEFLEPEGITSGHPIFSGSQTRRGDTQ